jgi:hypothetical protein
MLKKAKNKCTSIYNCSLFIEIFRKLSKHTPYMQSVCEQEPETTGVGAGDNRSKGAVGKSRGRNQQENETE